VNWDKPDRNFVIMGMARSGTSLACKLVSEQVRNSYCLNDAEINFNKVPALLAETRRCLVNREPVTNRFRGDELSSDTVRVLAPLEPRVATGDFNSNAAVGVKMIPEYRKAIAAGYLVIAMLRDPVYAIASWGSHDIAWAHVTDDDMDPIWRYRGIKFKMSSQVERQCEIWEFFAKQILEAKASGKVQVDVWKYEGLVALPDLHIRDFASYFGLAAKRGVRLANLNDPSRFYGIRTIRDAVAELCPSRLEFGYA